MSSTIKEIKKLREILGRKQVSYIKKKYCKVEKRICKKLTKCSNDDKEAIEKCNFIEFKKRYFNNLYNSINALLENSICNIESLMWEFVCEKRRNRTFEVITILKNVLNKNNILWALDEDYVKDRQRCMCPEIINIFVAKECMNSTLNIFNLLGENQGNCLYIINDVKIQINFCFYIEENKYNLNKNNIEYCTLENENLPILMV